MHVLARQDAAEQSGVACQNTSRTGTLIGEEDLGLHTDRQRNALSGRALKEGLGRHVGMGGGGVQPT